MLVSAISTIFLATAANAAAITPVRADITPWKRDNLKTVWKAPPGVMGNTQVFFGDDRVYVGGCTPESIIKTLYDQCFDLGTCNPRTWTMQCVQGDSTTHTITMKVEEGQYQTWIKNGLVMGLLAAVKTDKVVEKKTITAMSGGGCVGCPWKAKNIDVYYMPGSFGISHANGPGQVPDVITFTVTNNDNNDAKGLCEILTGIGAGLAGAVNGVPGGMFTLASLACKALG